MILFSKKDFHFLPLFFFFSLLLFSCRETQSAVSCPGASSAGVQNKSGDAKKKHVSRRQKKAKGQDGFVVKDKSTKSSPEKAEKGKKKQKDETKIQKKFHLFQKNRATEKDVDTKEKPNSAKNERKQKKLIKKRSRHPEIHNPPKGQV